MALEAVAEGKVVGAFVARPGVNAGESHYSFLPWYSLVVGAKHNVMLDQIYSLHIDELGYGPKITNINKSSVIGTIPSISHEIGSFEFDEDAIINKMTAVDNLTRIDPRRCQFVTSFVCNCGNASKCVFNPNK
jgi:hypothetical protein